MLAPWNIWLVLPWLKSCPSQETEVTSTPTRPVENVLTTNGQQDRNIQLLDRTTVENKGKLILSLLKSNFKTRSATFQSSSNQLKKSQDGSAENRICDITVSNQISWLLSQKCSLYNFMFFIARDDDVWRVLYLKFTCKRKVPKYG